MRRRTRPSRAGLSLIEVVISTLLVGLVVISALKSVGAVIRGRMHTGDAGKAQHLAGQLMAEILQKDYRDPNETPIFGRESSETNSPRASWDDVDDYHLWSSSPPEDASGMAIPESTDWERSAIVEWVNPENPAMAIATGQGVKRITVTVKRNGVVLAPIGLAKHQLSRRNVRMNSIRSRPNRKGSALYLSVISTAMIVTLLGLAGLKITQIERGQMAAGSDQKAARMHANSAVELALRVLAENSDWRSDYRSGTETAPYRLGRMRRAN